jgi:GH15 family glucan-1,4-alpha-glucosidase
VPDREVVPSQPTTSPSSALQWPDIQDYGIIGNCRSAALVSKYGSIDWLCWPRFDKPSIFAALLDRERGGHWRISSSSDAAIERRYLPNSNVLETRFTSATGTAILTDVMPGSARASRQNILVPDYEILRRITCITGEFELEIEFSPMADYGKDKVQIRQFGRLGLRFSLGRGVYFLRSSVALTIGEGVASAHAFMRAGESLRFSFSYSEQAPAVLPPVDSSIDDRIEVSAEAWQKWSSHTVYDGEYRETVMRSALALKLLSYAPSGAIIAAPTTSLPELIGGD